MLNPEVRAGCRIYVRWTPTDRDSGQPDALLPCMIGGGAGLGVQGMKGVAAHASVRMTSISPVVPDGLAKLCLDQSQSLQAVCVH